MLIELAGVPVEICCRFPSNERFLEDYRTDKPPVMTVRPGPEDLEAIREAFIKEDRREVRYDPAYLENNAIHALLAEGLVQHDVLLMHGSALCMDGLGYIFAAKSGTGKSTHARLWRREFGNRVFMINDDKPMLRIEEGRVTVYGTPWDGKHRLSRNASAPLKAIAQLCRGDENRIEPLSKAGAFQMLMKHAYISRDPAVMARIMALEKRLVDSVPFYHLQCNMEPEAARVARAAMSAGCLQVKETAFEKGGVFE
ncbi:MAG: hypothetical protein E7317_11405 [Clostridiales bacterium]|nr:hypothetical protein [Clostridiales bacterium]